jgi:hypothetical protein
MRPFQSGVSALQLYGIDAELEFSFGYWCTLTRTRPSSPEGKTLYQRLRAERGYTT